MAKTKKFSAGLTFLACLLALIIGFVAGAFVYFIRNKPSIRDSYVSGDLSFHFMELGNKYTGDSIYIKAGDTDILIDAGSRASSTDTTSEYINQFCEDGVLEYVIVTHSDKDHIEGFVGNGTYPSIFDRYQCKVIIDFPKTNKKLLTDKGNDTLYGQYVKARDAEVAEGANHYTALECWNESKEGAKKSYTVSEGVEMQILYNYYYENYSGDENNYSVCVQFVQGDKKFLLTGDLEGEGEEKLIEYNDLGKVDLFKAGHHGSGTSSSEELLEIIQPDIVCVTCVAGTYEYADVKENTFPYQVTIDKLSKYTEKIYVTTAGIINDELETIGYESLHGNIVVTSNRDGIKVKCSANDGVMLKDTKWFKENRVWTAAANA